MQLKDKKHMQNKEELNEHLKDLDVSMGLLLTKPSQNNVLSFARQAKAVSVLLKKAKSHDSQTVLELYSDAVALHHAIVVFNTDPNLVKENSMARLLSGLTPALLSLEEFISGEDVNFWEILIDGSAVISHVIATTPYVTAAKSLVDFRFEKELVKVEERLVTLFNANGTDHLESISKAAAICDELRKMNLGYSEKPGYIFLFRYSILIITYKNFKDDLGDILQVNTV